MKIALHDSDRTRFPNLPLMKLSAYHKAKGDTVERFLPLAAHTYDIVYSSKVFFMDGRRAEPAARNCAGRHRLRPLRESTGRHRAYHA